ncbi:MAG: malonyl-ACP O-methyltransferase BioC [Pseudomonadales bacterium]
MASTRTTLVLLHGWGLGVEVFDTCLPVLQQRFDVRVLSLPGYQCGADIDEAQWQTELLAITEQPFVLVAWSLGLAYAVRLALRYPARVSILINLAGNPCFMQRDDWPCAMPASDFRDFAGALYQQSTTELDNAKSIMRHFAALAAKGNTDEKSSIRLLRSIKPQSQALLRRGLQQLEREDLRADLQKLRMPVLHIHAKQDTLIPIAVSDAILSHYPTHNVHRVEGGHAFFLEQADSLAGSIAEFVGASKSQANGLDKNWVARSFSRAAASYDDAAHLQRRVGDLLLDCAPALEGRQHTQSLLDLGSGTGFFTAALQEKYRPDRLLSVDIAEGMLHHAQSTSVVTANNYLCSDAEMLPFRDQSIAAICSNLMVQWCDLATVLSECWRVLKPNGKLSFSTLGPNTLQELRAAWAEVDNYVHVNRFVAHADVQSILQAGGWQVDVCVAHGLRLQYASFRELSGELKALGAHNVNTGRPKGLLGKNKFNRLCTAYEQFRDPEQKLPASYEVILVQATRPNE